MKRELLSEIRFGRRVAEEEVEQLVRYFVETDHWRRLFSDDVDVIYGPKGSGKSALYSLLVARRDALFDRRIILAPAENPRGAPAFRDLVTDPPASESEFIGLWKLYFPSLLNGVFSEYGIGGTNAERLRFALEREGLAPRSLTLSTMLRAALDYVRGALRPAGLEGGIEVDPLTGLPKGFKGKITFREPSAEGAAHGLVSIDTLLSAAAGALDESKFVVWILLDRLDVAFVDSPDLEQNALRALFHVYLDLLGLQALRLKVFLRTDIWRRITRFGFREASHITRHMTIEWSNPALMNLVVSRTIQNNQLADYYGVTQEEVLRAPTSQEAFFYRVFPDQVDVGPNKPRTFDWMLTRTRDGTLQNAPRELIHLLDRLREVQVRRLEIGDPEPPDEQLFVRPALKEALPEVSRARLEQTLYAEYPSFRERLEGLRRSKTLHTAQTLADLWKVDASNAAAVADQLVDVGFFEKRGSRETPEYWVPFLYRDALDLVQGTAE